MTWITQAKGTTRRFVKYITATTLVTLRVSTACADEPDVDLYKEGEFPGCADKGVFRTEFRQTLGARDWDYPVNQAPSIQVWIRPEAENNALSLEMLMQPYGSKPIHYARETFKPIECSLLVLMAARIAAVMVPPPEPAPPRLRKFLGIQLDSHVWPTPWTPSLTMGANMAMPWNPAWTIGATLGWALPITWEAPDGTKINIQVAGSASLHVHRNFEHGRIGGHVKGGTMLLEQAFVVSTKSGPASHIMAGINGGVYFKPWGDEPRAYLGADISFLTLRPSIRVNRVTKENLWYAPAANVSVYLLIDWH